MIKYCVGFQLREQGEEPFSQIVSHYRDTISELFFSWQDIPSGRGGLVSSHGFTDWSAQSRIEQELKAVKQMGIKLDILFNANCYGQYSISEKLANTVCSTLDYLDSIGCGVDVVTTASLAIAHTVKKHFPDIEVRASVNMKIGTVKGMEYISDLFDSFHVQRDYNRDISHLKMLKEWADANGKKLVMLANSGCFINCSGQLFHDNNVAHESEICEVNNLKDFNPYVCWHCLENKENWVKLLQNTWVRPEDIDNYEGIFDTVKLATRIHNLPGLVIDAYSRRSYVGNTLDLFEPTFSGALAPYIIDNSAFPTDWFEKTSKCDKLCHKCGYCSSVLEKVLVNTEAYNGII